MVGLCFPLPAYLFYNNYLLLVLDFSISLFLKAFYCIGYFFMSDKVIHQFLFAPPKTKNNVNFILQKDPDPMRIFFVMSIVKLSIQMLNLCFQSDFESNVFAVTAFKLTDICTYYIITLTIVIYIS